MPRELGMSLIELTAALAIFSLLAVMAIQLLSGALNTRTRVTSVGADAADIAATLSVLRRDLRAATFANRPGKIAGTGIDGPGLTLVTLASMTGKDADLGAPWSVNWSVDQTDQTLRRMAAPLHDASAVTDVPVLTDVHDWSVRVLQMDGEWIRADAWAGRDVPSPPRAVEVRFSVGTYGPVRVLVAL
ncbi:MAG: type II secretion system protein GspJ [Marinibacterium sp.]